SVVVDVTGTSGESACAFCRRVGKRALGSSAVRTRMWLANCCFAHISLGFPFLLRFCDEQPGHSFYPFYCYPGALARSWRRPFPRRGVASAQAPDPDLESLPETISEDRKSTRLNSSHGSISYAVFCLKKKKKTI